jgi:hypothetical protein
MNIQLSKNTLDLLAKCTANEAALHSYETDALHEMEVAEYHKMFETYSSNARMLAMSLQADKELAI